MLMLFCLSIVIYVRAFIHSAISLCRSCAMTRAVGVLMNSVASRSSFSSACLRTSVITCSSVYVGLACLVYSSARLIPIWPIASSLSASLTMWRTRA